MPDSYEDLLAECERHRKANLVRAVLIGHSGWDSAITDAVNAREFDAVPWMIAQSAQASEGAIIAAAQCLVDAWGTFCAENNLDDTFAFDEMSDAVARVREAMEDTPMNARTCVRCGSAASEKWWKCCPEHTTEQDPADIVCDACALELHPPDNASPTAGGGS